MDAATGGARQGEYGDRYWIRCSGRMLIATARVDGATEPTIIRDSADEPAEATEHAAPSIGRWDPP